MNKNKIAKIISAIESGEPVVIKQLATSIIAEKIKHLIEVKRQEIKIKIAGE